jgi:hypothetical protein
MASSVLFVGLLLFPSNRRPASNWKLLGPTNRQPIPLNGFMSGRPPLVLAVGMALLS